jgi:excisionase family DNA binding protein
MDQCCCQMPGVGVAEPFRHPRFYSVPESAGVARSTPQTVRRWIKSGKLTEYHAGRSLRVLADELHEFLRAGRVSVEPTVRRLEETAYVLNADQRARLVAALGISDPHAGAGGAPVIGMPAALDREQAENSRPPTASEKQVRQAIERRARELAGHAAPLTAEQMGLLKAIFGHRSGGDG